MRRETADEVAVKALSWLAGNGELMPVFLGATGSSADDLRRMAADPGFLVSVLEFLLMDDAWVIGFCDAEGLAYDMPMRAKQHLPSGAEMHWT